MRIDSKRLALLEKSKVECLSVTELVQVLISRYMESNGWEFVGEEDQASLFQILDSLDK